MNSTLINTKNILSLSVAALIAAPALAADENQKPAKQDKVVVTATRIAQTADQSLVPVTVIERADIENSSASSLPQLLAQTVGLNITSSGGYGANADLFLRGTSSKHTLILVDGVRMGSASLGATAMQAYSLANIERIEVIRGPRSSLYGSDAIGGVVQIFTRQGEGEIKPSFSLASGSHNSQEFSAQVGGGDADAGFNINASHFKSDGIDAHGSTTGTNADKDPYRNSNISANIHQRLSARLSAKAHLLASDNRIHFDNVYGSSHLDPYSQNYQHGLGTGLNFAASDDWDLKLNLGESRDKAETFDDNASNIETRKRQLDFLSDHYLSDDAILSLGGSYENIRVINSGNFRSSQDNKAAFAQYQRQFTQWSVLAGLRVDDNENFGKHSTGNLNLAYQVNSQTKVLGSYGTGFKAPTMNDLYYPSSGNPSLKPEKSQSWELGLEHKLEHASLALRAYRNDIDDLIAWAPAPLPGNPWRWSPSNVNRARIDGVEFELSTVIKQWNVSANANLMDPKDRDSHKQLIRRPEQSASLAMSRRFDRYTFSADVLAEGPRFNDDSNSVRVAGHAIANVKVNYKVDAAWQLSASIQNLLDQRYTTIIANGYAYNNLGRTLMLGIHYGL